MSEFTSKLILASSSPRRRQLLENLGLSIQVIKPDIEELRKPGETPEDYVKRNCMEKAEAVVDLQGVAGSGEKRIVLAADTIVVLDGQVLEKPVDRDEAFSMLSQLSGRVHDVYTAFCLLRATDHMSHVELVKTKVQFRVLTPSEINTYIESGEPMDKAGAYGIQEIGAGLVKSLDGSYTNVVGLPLAEVIEALRASFN